MATGFPVKANYATGDILTATNMNDLAGTLNSITSDTLSVSAGKNSVINGGFDIWQRGTSVAIAASTAVTTGYTADRWTLPTNANQACTVSRQATGDTTNLPNIQYCARVQRNSGQTGVGVLYFGNTYETVNSIPFAGKNVTVSFYARAGANFSPTANALGVSVQSGTGTDQNFFAYTGGAAVVSQTATLTTTWQRFTYTGAVASTATELNVKFSWTPTGTASTNDYFEVTGVQLELGSTATSFSRAGGTIQGELAGCQRYYQRFAADAANYYIGGYGSASSVTSITMQQFGKSSLRTSATSIDYSNLVAADGVANLAVSSATVISIGNPNFLAATLAVTGATAFRTYTLASGTTTAGYIGWSAEL